MNISRRNFLSKSAACAFLGGVGGCMSLCDNGRYPGWHLGEMDIHLIHTGQGESTFFIFPDGTTMLLDCGYDVNHKNSRGITLLMLCSVICWSSGVQSLLEYGAYPSIKDQAGQTALFYATCYNNVCYDEIIDYLIEYGANINEVDSDGNTALLQIAHEEIEGDRRR